MNLQSGEVGAPYAKVTLDGVDVTGCISASEESGEVLVYVKLENGLHDYDVHLEQFKTELRKGVVRINLPPEFAWLRYEQISRDFTYRVNVDQHFNIQHLGVVYE